MRHSFFVILILVLFYSNSFTQNKKIEFQEYTLSNGLKVILNEDHSIPIVVVNICYHVGSKNETPKIAGFAHLFEHLMFESSANVKRGEFDKYIYSAGGDDNAFTTEDITNYYDLLPVNQLELALWLESDRMLQFGIRQESLDTQKGVVKEERKESYENRPYGSVPIKIAENAFKVHPYRWPIIGYAECIDSANLESVRNFYETYYVPNNAVMAISGDFESENVKNLVLKYFEGIPAGKNPIKKISIIEPEKTRQEREIVKDNITLPGLYISFHIPKTGTKEGFAFSLLSNILTSGESSRFYQKYILKDKVAVQISSEADLREDSGLLNFSLLSNETKKLEDIEKDIFAEIEKIKTDGIEEKELQKVKNIKETDLVFQLQSVQNKAQLLAIYKTLFNDANIINSQIENYLSITVEDVKNAAKKFLRKENSIVLHYIPSNKK